MSILNQLNDYVVMVKKGATKEERFVIRNWMWHEIDLDNLTHYEWIAWYELDKEIWKINILEN